MLSTDSLTKTDDHAVVHFTSDMYIATTHDFANTIYKGTLLK